MAPKDLALRRSDQRLAPISAYRRPFPPILKVASLSTVGSSSKLVGTLPEMVQTIVPKDFTQYCSSPPLCTMISYGYTLSLGRIFCLTLNCYYIRAAPLMQHDASPIRRCSPLRLVILDKLLRVSNRAL